MNKKMPKRNIAHQLETLSRNKFKSLLPEQWITNFSGEDKEYGLDGEVEIFTNEGNARGISIPTRVLISF